MKISYDIKIIKELLNLSQQELADDLGTTQELVGKWENDSIIPEDRNINLIYDYAFEKKIYLNLIHEQMYKDRFNSGTSIVLFHGAKEKIDGSINFNHSRNQNDFGVGFYLGESFEQAASYIAYTNSHFVYSFTLNTSDLTTLKFDVSLEWMLAIAYYRGWIDKYKNNRKILNIIEKIERADIIIAPIADNRMFDLIDEFVNGMITDLQCRHALSATNLGYQYVVKTEKALSNLSLIDELFIANKEKEQYLKRRMEMNKIGLDKVKIARIEYKNKGEYIEELLK